MKTDNYSHYLWELTERYSSLAFCQEEVKKSFFLIVESLEKGGTLFLCGNGGSAADAEHIAGELLKEFKCHRRMDEKFKMRLEACFGEEGKEISSRLQPGLRAIALTSHLSFSTAFSNDVDGSLVFAQQLYALGKEEDIVLGITTSGNSGNVIKCLQTGRAMGMKTIAMTGKSGGKCLSLVDCCIRVPETETYKVQELHQPVYHALCLMLENYFYGK